MSKIAIVTGANKGIGLETCRALATSGQYAHVYLTSRSLELGQAALADVKSCTANSVKYHQLDIACSKSIKSFREYIEGNYNGFDVLGETYVIKETSHKIPVKYKMPGLLSKTQLLNRLTYKRRKH